MAVDAEKIRIFLRAADVIRELNIAQFSDFTDEKIDQLIQTARMMPGNGGALSEEELAEIRKEMVTRYRVYAEPGQAIVSDYDQGEWYTDIRKNITPRFWSRYKNYLIDVKHFSPNVISTLGDDTLDLKLMNFLGNPNDDHDFLKRGLIIGDVQSGKTSTYIGLMCKAADAGYKVFILLTGTIESLRQQTQERVEEGFIGMDITNQVRVGVGLDNKDILATSLTSRTSDFTGKSDQSIVALTGANVVVFVIKKNTTVLRKLTDWLITINADPVTKRINIPMLLIDDEADNASINTSKERENPTIINKHIRRLLSVFTKSNYVGFTATPFANVFIDPETTEEMENCDLFPEDFIVALPTPSNYIGPSKIFPEKSKYHSQVIYIEDAGKSEKDGFDFYYKHKRDWDGNLPESLTDSLYAFYIANAIRDLRGDQTQHRSMLINISRFVDVQERIKQKVELLHKAAYSSIKLNAASVDSVALKDPVISRVHRVWEEQYKDKTEFDWSQIARVLFKAIEDIQIKVVNSSRNSEKLNYPKDDSLRVIAIGGLALSRGLTLEGLVTNYFFRNTCTYDVLMQMGRWFGYRNGYDDLFRIWTEKTSAKWYAEIAEATDELKRDMEDMREQNLKPRDFGIRVRDDSDELHITSPNKMRNTSMEFEYKSYFGGYMETPYLSPDVAVEKKNYNRFTDLISSCYADSLCIEDAISGAKHGIIHNVPRNRISTFIRGLDIPKYSATFDTAQISSFIDDCDNPILENWDILIMTGKSQRSVMVNNREFNLADRTDCEIDPDDRLKIGRRGKLGGPSDGRYGMTSTSDCSAEELIIEAKNQYRTDHPSAPDNVTYPSDTWFKYIADRNPMLIVYLIDANDNTLAHQSSEIATYNDAMGDTPTIGFAVGFPKSDDENYVSKSKYQVNRKYNYYDDFREMQEEEE